VGVSVLGVILGAGALTSTGQEPAAPATDLRGDRADGFDVATSLSNAGGGEALSVPLWHALADESDAADLVLVSQAQSPSASAGSTWSARLLSWRSTAVQLTSGFTEAATVALASDNVRARQPAAEGEERPEGEREDSQEGQQREPLGRPPVDTSLAFLRSETILLEPGEWQLDYGIEYLWQDAVRLALLPGPAIALERVRERLFVVPLAARYGWSPYLQLFLNAPVGVDVIERANPIGDRSTTVAGMGDISFGCNYLLQEHDRCRPDILVNVLCTAPTGSDPFGDFDEPSLGNGFWAVAPFVTVIKAVDPLVVFGTVGYRHQFEAEHVGRDIQPGEEVFGQFGTGFAVNDRITLSTILQYNYETRFQVDDRTIPGTSTEEIAIRMALTAFVSRREIVEPFVRFGLTPDAEDADFGVVFTRTF
jgi:hypothetical protein